MSESEKQRKGILSETKELTNQFCYVLLMSC